MDTTSKYDLDLGRRPANFEPLTPISFLERSAAVYPEKTAIIHGDIEVSYQRFYERARQLAYLLYQVADRRGWATEAVAYNSLVQAWPELARLAGRPEAPTQPTLEE